MTPLRSLCKPSASDPVTVISTFWSPSVSNHFTSSLNKLAHCSKCSPWKRREWSVNKARLSHKRMTKQSERLSNTKQREIPDSITPAPSSSAKASTPCIYPQTGPVHLILLLCGNFSLLTLWWLIWKWDNPDERGDLAGRFGKQMFWSDGSVFVKMGIHTAMKLYD